MKKFELINKSVFAVIFFIFLAVYSYSYYGYTYYLVLSAFLCCFFWLLGCFFYKKVYFIFVFLNMLIIVFYTLGLIYLTAPDGWLVIFRFLFLFILFDFLISFRKIIHAQKKHKDNNFLIDNNLDNYSADFEIKYGKVWGNGIIFQYIFILYVIIIGPYFIVINSPFNFYAGEMIKGIKSNLSVYIAILLILLIWEYTLKRIYFFSGLNYIFDDDL